MLYEARQGLARLSFGKHAGKRLSEVPTSYLKWALGGLDALDPWLRQQIRDEVCKRGTRFLPADEVLADLEELVTRRVADDDALDAETAGQLSDHLMDAFDELRTRHGIGSETELTTAPRGPARRSFEELERTTA
jgi:hypothetical protein